MSWHRDLYGGNVSRSLVPIATSVRHGLDLGILPRFSEAAKYQPFLSLYPVSCLARVGPSFEESSTPCCIVTATLRRLSLSHFH